MAKREAKSSLAFISTIASVLLCNLIVQSIKCYAHLWHASLIMYNFGVFLANKTSEENSRRKRSPDNKYQYEVDFSPALSTAGDYFLRPPEDEVDIIRLLTRFVHAAKEPFRK